MAPLEALERDYPLIDSNFRLFCASHGIFTFEDILLHDVSVLDGIAGRDNASEKLKLGIKQLLIIIESQHRTWLNGLELLEDAQLNCSLSTGCKGIDALLQGGICEGHVTEIVGSSSSFKTQVCFKAASHVARKYSGNVIYFDTDNSFSPKRVAQFLGELSDPAYSEVKQTVQRVMNNIVCHSIFDIFTLLDLLHQLMNNLKSQTDSKVKLLIIDSISSLIAPVLGGGGAHAIHFVKGREIFIMLLMLAGVIPKLFLLCGLFIGHSLMVTAGFLLKELAYEHKISVVVTNHMVVAGEAGISKPALGESWKSIPHVRLLLSRNHETNGSCITILKHPSLGIGKSIDFII